MLTADVVVRLVDARRVGRTTQQCSLDLQRTLTEVRIDEDTWSWKERQFPYPKECKERTIYHWINYNFQPVARYSSSLIKLVPTSWGPPTFEIDGIKMLPSEKVSPHIDARNKVSLIRPRGKRLLDTCGGLGYFAAHCLDFDAAYIWSYEKNPDVIWLRGLNPWSPPANPRLSLIHGDVTGFLHALPAAAIDAVLHDPPRFGIAGELYSQQLYNQLARVLVRGGLLFHYTGAPNKVSGGRHLAQEVSTRLQRAGFSVKKTGDGLLAEKK